MTTKIKMLIGRPPEYGEKEDGHIERYANHWIAEQRGQIEILSVTPTLWPEHNMMFLTILYRDLSN